jgi:hypothetical protein
LRAQIRQVAAKFAAMSSPDDDAVAVAPTVDQVRNTRHDVQPGTEGGELGYVLTLAATAILRGRLPQLKIRFINVVDLMRLQDADEHPHGATATTFRSVRDWTWPEATGTGGGARTPARCPTRVPTSRRRTRCRATECEVGPLLGCGRRQQRPSGVM